MEKRFAIRGCRQSADETLDHSENPGACTRAIGACPDGMDVAEHFHLLSEESAVWSRGATVVSKAVMTRRNVVLTRSRTARVRISHRR